MSQLNQEYGRTARVHLQGSFALGVAHPIECSGPFSG